MVNSNGNRFKCVVFSPYFGKLPVWFNLWLKSCSFNKDFRFIVFTDDDISNYVIPDNVTIINLSFDDFRGMIQKRFDFKIALNNPYKLCDYKPAYGYIFSDYIEDYEYWGYCDLDIIFGRISDFMPSYEFDKISHLGHFCLYKNIERNNKAFMDSPKNAISYKEVFSNDQHFGFDEIGNYGINNIYKMKKLRIGNFESNAADVDCKKKKIHLVRYTNGRFIRERAEKFFVFEEGRILSFDIKDRKKVCEHPYVHFQKRRMINNVKNKKKFIITDYGFLDYCAPDSFDDNGINKGIDFKWLKFGLLSGYKRTKRLLVIKKIQKRKVI